MSIFASLQNLFHSLGGKGKNSKKPEKKDWIHTPEKAGTSSPAPKPEPPISAKKTPAAPPESPSSSAKKTKKKQENKKDSVKNKRKRTGIPIIKKDADLEQMMLNSVANPEQTKAMEKLSPHQKKRKRPPSKKQASTGKNKHGIPVLKDGIDFDLAFRTKEEKTDAEENFAVLLEQSLGSRELGALLHEKKQKPPSPSISLKERLARYPSPEETLDLHGFSGIQASLKTEIFLENAKRKGLFTVRIITGKGLHSDGPAILPGIVEQKILDFKKKDLVLAHKWENKSGKNHGSVQVFLKHFQ